MNKAQTFQDIEGATTIYFHHLQAFKVETYETWKVNTC